MADAFEEWYSNLVTELKLQRDDFCVSEMIPIMQMIAAMPYCNIANISQDDKVRKIREILSANRDKIHLVDARLRSYLHYTLAPEIDYVDTDVVKELLSFGVDPNKIDKRGDSPLHLAACISQSGPEIVRHLLKQNANPNIQNNKGDTPLHIAVRTLRVGSSDTIKLLLDHGATVDTSNYMLRNTFHAALENTHPNLNFVKMCIECHPHLINSCDLRNITPLHLAVLESQNKIEVIKELLNCGANVSAKDIAGRTPLHWIQYYSSEEKFDFIKAFTDKGADIDARDLISRTPLFCAVRSRSHIISKQLIMHGADLNSFDFMHKSILNEAVNGFEICEKIRLAQPVCLQDFKSELVRSFHSCQLFRPILNSMFRHTTLNQLMSFKTSDDPLHIENLKQIDIIRLLLENDADPDFGNLEYRLTPFHEDTPCGDKILIQYRVIRNFVKAMQNQQSESNLQRYVEEKTSFDIQVFNEEFKQSWINYRNDCISEVSKMLTLKLDIHSTLFEFISGRCCKCVVPKILDSIILDRFFNLFKNFPHCQDIMLAAVKREELEHRLYSLKVYSKRSSEDDAEVVTLNPHVVCYFSKCLSKTDLLNLILAFLPEKETPESNDPIMNRKKRKVEQIVENIECKRQNVGIKSP